jgi:acyl dehydratase
VPPPLSDPAPPPRFYWEDFPVGEVREFGRYEVTRDAVLAFAGEFDPQPFHLDDAAAEASLFGRLAASGWHTCAMAMRLMVDKYVNRSASLGSPGLDNIRWLAPVRAGDTITYRRSTTAARISESKPGIGLLQSRWEAVNQRGETVMTMEGWGMFRRRPTAGSPPSRGRQT